MSFELEGKDPASRWDKIIEDKTAEMTVWIDELRKIVGKGVKTYAFFNFAPGSVTLFEDLSNRSHAGRPAVDVESIA